MMERLIIEGGRPLRGEMRLQGSKNSVLPILAGTVLTEGVCVIDNCPDLKDVASAVAILRHLGCGVKREGDRVTVDASTLHCSSIPLELMREMRSSVIFMGPVLSRCGSAQMDFPGGCELGPRPIDLHISGMKKLGAEFDTACGGLTATAGRLHGAHIQLAFPSVGATENLMLAAAVSEGVTVIDNAAKEPEIEDLERFLRGMGAQVAGGGSSRVMVRGVEKLHGTQYCVMPDRIAGATYLTAAAITRGDVTVRGICPTHLESVLTVLEETGCEVRRDEETVELSRKGPILPVRQIQTMPYPGFPTDAQSVLMAYLTLAQGTSTFVENIFESRYKQVGELTRMGADIRVLGRAAIVCGVPRLHGSRVDCTDLRGGAALVLAALAADGESEIGRLWHIDRGYDKMEQYLMNLGAAARRVSSVEQ